MVAKGDLLMQNKHWSFIPGISDFPSNAIASFPEEVIFFVEFPFIFTNGNIEAFFLKVRLLFFAYRGFL